MNSAEQIAFVKDINDKGLQLLVSKGHDYAGEDVLQNFKQLTELNRLLKVDMKTIEGTHMFYILLKIQRLSTLLFSNKTPANESIQDTLIDLRNYVDLLNCTLNEKQCNVKENTKNG